jgi:hypothetical protein
MANFPSAMQDDRSVISLKDGSDAIEAALNPAEV